MPGGVRYTFDRFELNLQTRRVTAGGDPIPLADRHFDVLLQLVSHPGAILPKDALIDAAWGDVAVTDNSLEQAVSALRRELGNAPEGGSYIETIPRRGYRFNGTVARAAARQTDEALEALLAPHRAWVEGRAALETLERDGIGRARAAFEQLLRSAPEQPLAHIGLANACALQFETTRADEARDTAALVRAMAHAREACRLDPQSGEAWASLGFVLDRSGQPLDATAALRRAVMLEPDNWRHHFRLSYVGWGEDRLREARRTLALLPGFPLAHWMIATVQVARRVLDQAEIELEAGIAVQERQGAHARFSAVGLHWLRGLIHLARSDEAAALAALERELSCESLGHLYSRECGANAWYAIGALHLRQHHLADARLAFARALERLPAHPLARIALAAAGETRGAAAGPPTAQQSGSPIDIAIYQAAALVLQGHHRAAAHTIDEALAAAPPGSGGWLLPVEPLLNVNAHPDIWAPALARLQSRAS